jgi:hypothetical protein
MSKEDFAAYFAVLEKSSDRARSIIYAFVIVYITLLFYALNTLAYPTAQYLYNDFTKLVECWEANQNCTAESHKEYVSHLKEPPQLRTLEESFWQHQRQLLWDESLALRTYHVPIFGVGTDRDLVWITFPFLGIFGYYLIWLALARVKSLFCFLAEQNKSDPMRLRLILSTQLLTSPLNDESIELGKFHQTAWMTLATSVTLVPIFASLVIIWDQIRLRFIFSCVCELILLAFQCMLLGKLIDLSRAFGRVQGVAERSINHAES